MSRTNNKMGKTMNTQFGENSSSSSGERESGLSNGIQLKSSVGLVGCLVNIAKYVLAVIFNLFVVSFGINWILEHFGVALKPLNLAIQAGKRKYSEVDEDVKDSTDYENENENLEKELKRWRPDQVYEAINDFVKKMWGESDMNENLKNGDVNDENMNNFPMSQNNGGRWKQKPDINFVVQKIVGVKLVEEGEGSIRDLTPKKPKMNEEVDIRDTNNPRGEVGNDNLILPGNETIETSTPLIDDLAPAPNVFVFSADKTVNSNKSGDIEEDEQSMLSLMTFGEKQVYFDQKIKEAAAAALKTTPLRFDKKE